MTELEGRGVVSAGAGRAGAGRGSRRRPGCNRVGLGFLVLFVGRRKLIARKSVILVAIRAPMAGRVLGNTNVTHLTHRAVEGDQTVRVCSLVLRVRRRLVIA